MAAPALDSNDILYSIFKQFLITIMWILKKLFSVYIIFT